MLYKDTNRIKDFDTRELFEHVQKEGMQNIIELTAVPTSSEPLLDVNQVGYYGTDIYWRISSSSILKFSPDDTI